MKGKSEVCVKNRLYARGKAASGKRFLLRRFWASEDANQLVEFAVVLPLFVLLLTGTVSVVLGLYNFQQLAVTTAQAAQQVAVAQATTASSDPCTAVVTYVKGALPSWASSSFTYTVSVTDSGGTAHSYGPTASSLSCTTGASYMGKNEPLTVTVAYPYNWMKIVGGGKGFSMTSTTFTSTQSSLIQ